MSRKIIFISLLLISLLFTACEDFANLFGNSNQESSEAVVLTFSVAGQVGDVEIDVEAKTINLVLGPMDIADAVCTITVSNGADFIDR